MTDTPQWFTNPNEAKAEGREEERAKIVAWLRHKASQRRNEVETEWLNLAASIERGEHEAAIGLLPRVP